MRVSFPFIWNLWSNRYQPKVHSLWQRSGAKRVGNKNDIDHSIELRLWWNDPAFDLIKSNCPSFAMIAA